MRRKNRNAWRKRQNDYNNYNQYHNQANMQVNYQAHHPQLINQNQITVEKNDSDDIVAGGSDNNILIDTNTGISEVAGGSDNNILIDTNTGISEVAGGSDNNILIDTNTGISEETQEIVQKEDTDEQNLPGKSTGINNDQTSNNIDIQPEIENENVQGSAPSPNAIDEHVQNINDNNVTNNESNEEVTNESAPVSESKTVEESDQCDNNQPENQEEVFQSGYANDQENSVNGNAGDVENGEERSHTPELKPSEEKLQKHIKLKRSPPARRSRRPSSPLEDGEIKEPQEKSSKKITLKRHAHSIDDSNSDFINKIIINRRPSGGDDKSEKRRLSAEEKTHVVVGRPNRPAKPVKLNRHFSCPEEQDSVTPPRSRRLPWGKSDWLENISATTYKIDVNTIKIICPTVEFLDESEVKLESVLKERTKSESDAVKKKVEEEEKTEDESEREQSEEEDSTEEQKIEANPNIIALNRKISIVDDTAGKLRPPPSPAKNPPSDVLYITNLVRPFTLKQLKELLERTGKIKADGFWTDRIKSKCYVQYQNVEEAETTRNALHGVYWPIGNGKQLIIEYATKEDMEKAKNPVPLPTVIPDKLPEKENREPEVLEVRRRDRERVREREPEKEDRRREPLERERNKSRDDHRRKRSKSKSRSRERVRKHSRRSYTPEDINRKKHKKVEDSVPQKLMDDLFLKTKTTPSIYWQPLSPQEIATKQQQRLVRMEEHKRRIEENRGRFRDRRGTFRRR